MSDIQPNWTDPYVWVPAIFFSTFIVFMIWAEIFEFRKRLAKKKQDRIKRY